MSIVDGDEGRIVVHLEPSDCLALAQACRAQVTTDRARDPSLAEARGMVGASFGDGGATFRKDFTRANVWAHHGPRETRVVGATHATDLDGNRADEAPPAEGKDGEAA